MWKLCVAEHALSVSFPPPLQPRAPFGFWLLAACLCFLRSLFPGSSSYKAKHPWNNPEELWAHVSAWDLHLCVTKKNRSSRLMCFHSMQWSECPLPGLLSASCCHSERVWWGCTRWARVCHCKWLAGHCWVRRCFSILNTEIICQGAPFSWHWPYLKEASQSVWVSGRWIDSTTNPVVWLGWRNCWFNRLKTCKALK